MRILPTMTGWRTSPLEETSHSDGNVRKRVCKACDRCRMKKSKCDGANACGRCRADNAICVFGERKKVQDKQYPKGYVEMLEQQQIWLVHGLQELYRLANRGSAWPGPPLRNESNDQPLTHDLLTHLGALDQSKGEHFEENTSVMQQELWRRSRQDPQTGSDGGAVRSPVTSSDSSQEYRNFAAILDNQNFPPTPSSHSPPQRPQVKTEPMSGSDYVPVLTQQQQQLPISPVEVVEPSALQWNASWTTQPTMTSYDDIDFLNQDLSGSASGGYMC